MRAIFIFLLSVLLLPGCGFMRLTENTVTAKLENGGSTPRGLRTKIEFEPDFPFDKTTNMLIYAWSPIAIFESGKKFQLELIFRQAGGNREEMIRIDAVTLVEPSGERRSISMSSASEWLIVRSDPVKCRSTQFFALPSSSGCRLEIDFTLKKGTGATTGVHQQWKLQKTSVSHTAVGLKSA